MDPGARKVFDLVKKLDIMYSNFVDTGNRISCEMYTSKTLREITYVKRLSTHKPPCLDESHREMNKNKFSKVLNPNCGFRMTGTYLRGLVILVNPSQ